MQAVEHQRGACLKEQRLVGPDGYPGVWEEGPPRWRRLEGLREEHGIVLGNPMPQAVRARRPGGGWRGAEHPTLAADWRRRVE